MDVIDNFMVGLREMFVDEEVRYKYIVEECVYWCDINKLNVFICKMLLDPDNKYNLKYHEGDTLSIDLYQIFGYTFDLVVGNPPYQKNFNNENGRVGGSSLWSEFINHVFPVIVENGFLLFITPCSWMTGGSNKQSGNILRASNNSWKRKPFINGK